MNSQVTAKSIIALSYAHTAVSREDIFFPQPQQPLQKAAAATNVHFFLTPAVRNPLALLEDLGLAPSTYVRQFTTACTSSSRKSSVLFWTMRAPELTWYTHALKIIIFKNLEKSTFVS